MLSPTHDPMTSAERRGAAGLASIFAMRMLGLFLILPVFAVYAEHLPSGNDVALVGLALGAYGLTQTFLQIVYGVASDRFGRKPVIVFGLIPVSYTHLDVYKRQPLPVTARFPSRH